MKINWNDPKQRAIAVFFGLAVLLLCWPLFAGVLFPGRHCSFQTKSFCWINPSVVTCSQPEQCSGPEGREWHLGCKLFEILTYAHPKNGAWRQRQLCHVDVP